MATDFRSWDRVASELRACREAQQQAWGDVDNATLGRYLAGDVTSEERRRIEQELGRHPELRKLTDLVSDVIRDCEAAPEPAHPFVLSFSAAKSGLNTIRRRWRQWAAVAAAACLLFVLGYTVLPKGSGPSGLFPRGSLAQVTTSDFPTEPMASHLPLGANGPEPGSALRLAARKVGAAQPSAPLDHVAVVFADGCAEAADSYQRHGDLDLAAFSYHLAYNVREWKLGPEAEPTIQTRRNLGTVYQTALNMNEAVAATAVKVGQPALPMAVADKTAKQEVVQQSAATLCKRLAHQPVEEVRRSVVPILVAKLNEPDCTPHDREQLSRALAELGPAATDALPALDACLQNKNLAKRERAALQQAKDQLEKAKNVP